MSARPPRKDQGGALVHAPGDAPRTTPPLNAPPLRPTSATGEDLRALAERVIAESECTDDTQRGRTGRVVQVTPSACVSCTTPTATDAGASEGTTLFCPPCWDRRERGRLLAFDEDRLRRHEERRQRTAAALAERYCPACGFSFWRVSPRGDASCYACTLLREGKPLRCARCGLEEWQRDRAGRRVCATCAPGVQGPAPVEIAAPTAPGGSP